MTNEELTKEIRVKLIYIMNSGHSHSFKEKIINILSSEYGVSIEYIRELMLQMRKEGYYENE